MKKLIIVLMNLLFISASFGMKNNTIKIGKNLILKPKNYSLAAQCLYPPEDVTRLHPDLSPILNGELLWADTMQKEKGVPKDVTNYILLMAFHLQEKNYKNDFITYCKQYTDYYEDYNAD